MSAQIYSKYAIFVGGVQIAEATNISVDHKAGLQEIKTIEKGFAGMSPGSATTEIKLESAVPRVGVDFDYVGNMQAANVLDISIFGRGKKIKTKGFITDVSESGGADKAASMSITFMCQPAEESTL